MLIIRKMCAEKMLSILEGTNRILLALEKMPFIGSYINGRVIKRENIKVTNTIGVIAELFHIIAAFLKRYFYVLLLVILPCNIFAYFCPLIASNKESAILFVFFMLSTVCGSIANNILFAMGDRDYLMVRVVCVSPYMNFFGRLISKMVLDLVFYIVILYMFGVSLPLSILASIVNVSAKPIGEMIGIICLEHFHILYSARNELDGAIIAISVMIAYGVPLIQRKINSAWLFCISPVAAVIFIFAGVFALHYLWQYKYYRKIMMEAVHIKREI